MFERAYDLLHLLVREQPFWSTGGEVGEWRLVQRSWIHDAARGEVVNDVLDEVVLVRGEGLARSGGR